MEKYVSITRFDKDKNYAIVAKGKGVNRRYNFVNKSGKLISKVWFKKVADFVNNVAIVTLENGNMNYLTIQGKLLMYKNNNCKELEPFDKNGIGIITNKDGRQNYINYEGKLLSKRYFEQVYDFTTTDTGVTYAIVVISSLHEKVNVILPNGELLLKEHCTNILPFDDYSLVSYGDLKKWIRMSDGKVMSEGYFQNYKWLNRLNKQVMICEDYRGRKILINEERRFIIRNWSKRIYVHFLDNKKDFYIIAFFKDKDKYTYQIFSKEGKKLFHGKKFKEVYRYYPDDKMLIVLWKGEYQFLNMETGKMSPILYIDEWYFADNVEEIKY